VLELIIRYQLIGALLSVVGVVFGFAMMVLGVLFPLPFGFSVAVAGFWITVIFIGLFFIATVIKVAQSLTTA
jgi:hypothetical protein